MNDLSIGKRRIAGYVFFTRGLMQKTKSDRNCKQRRDHRKTTAMTGNAGITDEARVARLLRVFNLSVKADIAQIAPARVIDDLVIARERCIPRP
jgi:hypothetical protein